ncbi:MAG: hypothetical protein BEU01_00700 [Marine Group III euryarchaeote CG-Epi4]|uniref:PKD domain-containing protein n=1 Tax=Marine Group III euryarchaeote CG-Epi4 TaxID=1888998 RepID=A0A1J5U931_9ARCH|nr:MAG: hypothetical protein BEU01_00700 [Marine Group III euryarchaeote CG-Epi4]
MRYFIILAFMLVVLVLLSTDVKAEPQVSLVIVDPDTIDNQQEEDVYFNAECSVCDGEGLTYFYWNSSLDGVLSQGTENHNIVLSSSDFSLGDHIITFQVRDEDELWSPETDDSRTTIVVSGKENEGEIEVNFDFEPPVVHLGQSVNFRACNEMYPQAQPCVDDDDAELQFLWEVDWNNQGNWTYLSDLESFSYANLQEGTHTVKLSITFDGETANETQEFVVLPPIPGLNFNFTSGDSIKEGENLVVGATCFDNNQVELNCEYYWEVWDDDGNPDLLFELLGSSITVSNLTNSIGSYEFILRAKDNGTNIFSSYYDFIVKVEPPNVNPTASIMITPDSLRGLTPHYYQYSILTFISTSSDPDGNIIMYKWYFNNEVISEENQFSRSFNETGPNGIIHQIKLEVQDDDGVWSSRISTNFKIIPNSAPSVDFTFSSEESMYMFNSSVSDAEGSISTYQWSINGEFYSNDENITWAASETGTYTIALEVTDDGGMKSVISKDIAVKITEMKNFIAAFSSKNIDIGESFEMDFSQTTGDFDYFEIKVLYPNGTSLKYTVEDKSVNFSLEFDELGNYPIDVTVIWKDGIDRGLEDFYGPTVNVGQDNSNSDGESQAEETLTESSDDLPSLSVLVSVLLISIIAVSRRQR